MLIWRRSLKIWVKLNKSANFDVAMGSYDGAEVCELVGVFILNELSKQLPKQAIGLYRDDGLAILRNASGSDTERAKKGIVKVFKKFDRKITIDTNLKVTNFLDVTFDLETGSYKPFRKPGDDPLYINASSNHPPNILRNKPAAISKRISDISSNKQVFDDAAPIYRAALTNSGFLNDMEFSEKTSEKVKKKRNCQRNITWFNPPYSKSVKTNIASKFLKLISKHFPKGCTLYKIFNKNTVKVSYSCMPNISHIISGVNKKKLSPPGHNKPCNCRVKPSCPLNGDCQVQCIVYEAEVKADGEDSKIYTGLSEPPFKVRFANHQTSMKHRKYENSTELSKCVWQLRDSGKEHQVAWRVVEKSRAYSTTLKTCNLCTAEKYRIITSDQSKTLNKRSELVSKCRHRNKFLLSNYTAIT